jgi:hypothetical protein
MPKYRVETNERRWAHCVYKVLSSDFSSKPSSASRTMASSLFRSHRAMVTTGARMSQFLSVVEIKDEPEPRPSSGQCHRTSSGAWRMKFA